MCSCSTLNWCNPIILDSSQFFFSKSRSVCVNSRNSRVLLQCNQKNHFRINWPLLRHSTRYRNQFRLIQYEWKRLIANVSGARVHQETSVSIAAAATSILCSGYSGAFKIARCYRKRNQCVTLKLQIQRKIHLPPRIAHGAPTKTPVVLGRGKYLIMQNTLIDVGVDPVLWAACASEARRKQPKWLSRRGESGTSEGEGGAFVAEWLQVERVVNG